MSRITPLISLLLLRVLCAQPAQALRVHIDNFESGPINAGPGVYTQTNLPTFDCMAGARQITVGTGNWVVQGDYPHDDRMTFLHFGGADYIEYYMPSTDFTNGGLTDRIAIHVTWAPPYPPGLPRAPYFRIFAEDADGIFTRWDFSWDFDPEYGYVFVDLDRLSQWNPQACAYGCPPPDLTRIQYFLLDPEHQLEIADISLEGDPVQSMNFDLPSATWPTSDLPNLGLTARMKTQMGGYFTEQAPDVQLTLNNAYDAAMDLIQGEVIFQDSDEVDGAYGAAMGMILTETTPGAGATRTVEFELGFVDGTAAGVALQPLPDPAVDSERRWRQNLPLDFIGPTGALSSSGQMELRMKVPDNQPWMIAGIDVSPQPTEARWVATVVLQAMGAKTPLPDAALLEVTVTGDMTRVDGTDTPFQRPTGELRMWASPSVMDASTTFRFSRALPTPKKLQVYDVRGRLVRRLMMKAESVALPWDGRDDDGANLASGVYFAVIVDEVDRPSVKIVKMK